MRSGKSIWIIAGGIFVAWLLEPAWQWVFDRFLDRASRVPGGMEAAISKVIAVTAPLHPFLLGASVGMILAFAIGYWDKLVPAVRLWLEWCRAICWLLWNCRPGMRRVSYNTVWLRAGEATRVHKISAPVHSDTVRLEWQPKEKVNLRYTDSGIVTIRRINDPAPADITVAYEIWGHRAFWETLKIWRATSSIGLHLSYQKMIKEAAKAGEPEFCTLPERE